MSSVELLRTSVHSYILHSSGLLCPILAQLVPTGSVECVLASHVIFMHIWKSPQAVEMKSLRSSSQSISPAPSSSSDATPSRRTKVPVYIRVGCLIV